MKKVLQGISCFIGGMILTYLGSTAFSNIITALFGEGTDLYYLMWFGLVLIWILTVIVMPAVLIYQGTKTS